MLYAFKAPHLRIQGECKQCGECCKCLILVYRGKSVGSAKQFEKLVAKMPEYSRFVPTGKKDNEGALTFRCEMLGNDGLCKDHRGRPAICRDYPDKVMFERGGSLLEGCGYSTYSEVPFYTVLKSRMKPAWQRWLRRLMPFRD